MTPAALLGIRPLDAALAPERPAEGEAERIARILADDPLPTLAEQIAELARDEATLRARGTEAALASAEWARDERLRLEAELAAAEVCS